MVLRKYLAFWLLITPGLTYANNLESTSQNANQLLLMLAFIIGGAGFSSILRRLKFPTVVGEIALGLLIAGLAHYKLEFWEQMRQQPIITFLAELGSILLLFEIGLESKLSDLARVGWHGSITAIIGVVLPFILGSYLIGSIILSSHELKLKLFLGATLAATSAGISARVFKDLGILRNKAAQVVLSASIIDDVLGLIILALVVGLVASGSIDLHALAMILLNVSAFFLLMLMVVRKCMPFLVRQALWINNDEGMVVTILISFCLISSWFAATIGLAAIIGAFMAGLILDEIIFRHRRQPFWYDRLLGVDSVIEDNSMCQRINDEIVSQHQRQRLIDLIRPLNHIFVPIFFVYAGMQIDIIAVANWQVISTGLWISLVAIIGKMVSGIFLPKEINRWVVGFGMVPRGEVGLIFALTGQQLGIFSPELFASILMMVIISSLIPPLAIEYIIKRKTR